MLVHEPTADLAIGAILECPALHDEAKRALTALQLHAEPCGDRAVFGALSPLVAIFPQPDRSEDEWAAFWKLYFEALSDLPAEALRRAVKDYTSRADAEFFPKPGPLRAMAEKHAIPIRMAFGRAQRAANSLPRPKIDKEETAIRRAQVAEMLAGMRAPKAHGGTP